MSVKEIKTNVMRILDKENISYNSYNYEVDEHIDGLSVAAKIGESYDKVYKTLVAKSKSDNYVFVIPVNCELDLKKAARAVGEKSIEMLHLNDLQKTTGYIRGGCSPIGMKRSFPTVLHSDAEKSEYIIVSAGKRGVQVKLSANDLKRLINAQYYDIIKEE